MAFNLRDNGSRQGVLTAQKWIVALAWIPACLGGMKCGDDWQRTLDLHNMYRSWHSAAPLTWHKGLAANAQFWVEKLANDGCKLKHSGPGENLYANYGFKANGNCADAIDMWYAEVKNYRTNCPPLNNQFEKIGHFTQVVWKATSMVGCGSATNGKCVVVGCQYLQWGNAYSNAEFSANVGNKVGGARQDTSSAAPKRSPPPKKHKAPRGLKL